MKVVEGVLEKGCVEYCVCLVDAVFILRRLQEEHHAKGKQL